MPVPPTRSSEAARLKDTATDVSEPRRLKRSYSKFAHASTFAPAETNEDVDDETILRSHCLRRQVHSIDQARELAIEKILFPVYKGVRDFIQNFEPADKENASKADPMKYSRKMDRDFKDYQSFSSNDPKNSSTFLKDVLHKIRLEDSGNSEWLAKDEEMNERGAFELLMKRYAIDVPKDTTVAKYDPGLVPVASLTPPSSVSDRALFMKHFVAHYNKNTMGCDDDNFTTTLVHVSAIDLDVKTISIDRIMEIFVSRCILTSAHGKSNRKYLSHWGRRLRGYKKRKFMSFSQLLIEWANSLTTSQSSVVGNFLICIESVMGHHSQLWDDFLGAISSLRSESGLPISIVRFADLRHRIDERRHFVERSFHIDHSAMLDVMWDELYVHDGRNSVDVETPIFSMLLPLEQLRSIQQDYWKFHRSILRFVADLKRLIKERFALPGSFFYFLAASDAACEVLTPFLRRKWQGLITWHGSDTRTRRILISCLTDGNKTATPPNKEHRLYTTIMLMIRHRQRMSHLLSIHAKLCDVWGINMPFLGSQEGLIKLMHDEKGDKMLSENTQKEMMSSLGGILQDLLIEQSRQKDDRQSKSWTKFNDASGMADDELNQLWREEDIHNEKSLDCLIQKTEELAILVGNIYLSDNDDDNDRQDDSSDENVRYRWEGIEKLAHSLYSQFLEAIDESNSRMICLCATLEQYSAMLDSTGALKLLASHMRPQAVRSMLNEYDAKIVANRQQNSEVGGTPVSAVPGQLFDEIRNERKVSRGEWYEETIGKEGGDRHLFESGVWSLRQLGLIRVGRNDKSGETQYDRSAFIWCDISD